MTNNDALETLLARHKKEQRSLVAQATALKKSVAKGEKAKKKEVLSEIQRLEDVLKSQHKKELAELRDSTADSTDSQSSNDSTLHTSAQDSELPMIQALSSNRESSPPKVELKGSGGKPKVNRQKARMAKRAAEIEEQREQAAQEAASMPDLTAQEQSSMQFLFTSHSLREESVRPDGNCMYAAFASQINSFRSSKVDHKTLRSTAAEFIRSHKHDFEPFLFADEYSSAKDIESYCNEIEQTALWGGELEITALSRAMRVPVEIYSNRSKTPLVIEPPDRNGDGEVVRLAYYQHLYGLGQHYNGLFKI